LSDTWCHTELLFSIVDKSFLAPNHGYDCPLVSITSAIQKALRSLEPSVFEPQRKAPSREQ